MATTLKRQTVERFPEGATQEEKSTFAKNLIAALERIEVGPGDGFEVLPTGALDDELARLEEELEEAQAEASDVKELEEWIADVERGIMTFPELLEKVRTW